MQCLGSPIPSEPWRMAWYTSDDQGLFIAWQTILAPKLRVCYHCVAQPPFRGRQGHMFATHRRRLSSGCSKSQEESYVMWKLGAPLTTNNPRNLSNGLHCLCARFYPRKSREKHNDLAMHWTYFSCLILSLVTPHSHLSSLDLRGSRL